MKAVKLTICFRDWDMLDNFVMVINQEDEVLAYRLNPTTALLVAFGDYEIEWLKLQAKEWFNSIDIVTIK